ncbi:hypothetical protein OPV22_028082 [Ensete ventricosum]|uniref:Glucose-methanol-choline oxidoreductase N-terminal domain-containing protein n=1 Tax=Ensete ventricosum TaxID=4639 RepID=A0AAV8Q9G7_ENSVE|nr:hypothetical protein OPV22_028082 [Ensete ventricosum]
MILLLLSLFRSSQGRVFTKSMYPYIKKASSFSSVPGEAYDYIIVGGGTAGASPSYVNAAGWDGQLVNESRGFRHTAADLLAAGDPNNLRVLLRASVQKIVFDTRGRRPKAVAVQFKDENGRQHQAVLEQGTGGGDVIVSAGAIGSPQLLLLSGIGPKHDLEKLRIPVVLHNQHVGKGMSDNPMNSIFIPTKKPVRQSLIQTVGITKMGTFIEASSGFSQSSDSIQCHHGIMSAEIGQLSAIPPAQRSLEAAQKYARNKQNLPREAFRGGFILEKIDGPLSTGELNLLNTDVDFSPSVTFNYFRHPYDLKSNCDDDGQIHGSEDTEGKTGKSSCSIERRKRMAQIQGRMIVMFVDPTFPFAHM